MQLKVKGVCDIGGFFWFQFQLGAIKGYFLNLSYSYHFLFQFQLGAIKGILSSAYEAHAVQFQFQLGAIKGSYEEFKMSYEPSFNSN